MQRFPIFLCGLFMCGFALQAQESAPDFDIVYRTVAIDHDEYQTIITKPKSVGHYPAVLLIAGLGCYSLDHLKPDDPYAHLLNGLTRKGFVTMRVEKNGEGQSQGPPCDSPQSDLQLAVRRSLAGLDLLSESGFVDPHSIFIFAHSIGPLEGVQSLKNSRFAASSLRRQLARAGSNINSRTHAVKHFCSGLMMRLIAPFAQLRSAPIYSSWTSCVPTRS